MWIACHIFVVLVVKKSPRRKYTNLILNCLTMQKQPRRGHRAMTGTFNPAMTNYAFIFPGGPRRSYRRSYGTCASPSRISAICLLAAESSKRPHAWNIRYQRWSEWSRLRQPDRFLFCNWGCCQRSNPSPQRVAICGSAGFAPAATLILTCEKRWLPSSFSLAVSMVLSTARSSRH